MNKTYKMSPHKGRKVRGVVKSFVQLIDSEKREEAIRNLIEIARLVGHTLEQELERMNRT